MNTILNVFTVLTLAGAGLLGILTHNLMKIDTLVRKSNGKFDGKQFFKMEWASICISICVIVVAIMCRQVISELEHVGKWLAGGFYGIGLAAQSVAYWARGKAETFVQNQTPQQ